MLSRHLRDGGILCHTKAFLGTNELLSTCKAFIHSSMEYFSHLWAGSPASHLAQLHTMETKAFKITGTPHNEAESMGLSLHHHGQVGGLSVFYCLLSGLVPSALSVLCPSKVSAGLTASTIIAPLVNPPKFRITAHLHSFLRLFSHLWKQLPHSLQCHSSLQVFKTKKLRWTEVMFSPLCVCPWAGHLKQLWTDAD